MTVLERVRVRQDDSGRIVPTNVENGGCMAYADPMPKTKNRPSFCFNGIWRP